MLTVQGALTIDRLPSLLGAHLDSESRLDLRNCTFVDPVGLVTLGVLAEHWGPAHMQSWLTPRDLNVSRYLSRMHLPKVLSNIGGMTPDVSAKVRSQNHEGYLCELRATASASSAGAIADIVLDRLGEADHADMAEVLYECLAEAWGNVVEHSEANVGFAAAQVLERGTRHQRIVIGIADGGVGIASTLRHRLGDTTDAKAIRAAVQGMSSTDDPARGTGLPTIRSNAGDLGGRLMVLSGAAGTTAYQSLTRNFRTAHAIPGTILGIELPCGVGA